MIEEAVVLTYLEWTRLIGNAWIRIDPSRIVRYQSDPVDYADVIFDLMRKAPDIGDNPADFILATLNLEAFNKHRSAFADLGYRLTFSTVNAFYSFTEYALAVHEHDARAMN